MSRLKDETLSIRTSAEIKKLLRMAAERERRSVASMIEILVLEYARVHGLKLDLLRTDTTKGDASDGDSAGSSAEKPMGGVMASTRTRT